MDADSLEAYLEQKEGIEVEFKESRTELNDKAFNSICAFLNRDGGHLFLGVEDAGDVVGVEEQSIQKIKDNIVKLANNPEKLHPPCYLSPEVIEYENKKIIHVYVPQSSKVHNTAGKILDRNEDGDFDVTNRPDHVRKLHLQKDSTYTENEIYSEIDMSHFREDLFERIRKLARSESPNHPWLEMGDEELLRSAGLYKQDHQTGKEGYTLAAVLLLGNDNVIRDVLPHHKTDAILRVENKDRFDDRDEIRTNLIDSYDRLMDFVAKHLPDKFHNEGDQRISLRDRIFHEVIGNLLIHREYTNAYPAKFIIEENRVLTENWNRPENTGTIDPEQFSPHPKNPTIATFFNEIGRADELGSGVRNTFKYCEIYSDGKDPEFIEDDVFKAIIPLEPVRAETGVTSDDQQIVDVSTLDFELNEKHWIVLDFCEEQPRKKSAIMEELDLSHRDHVTNKYIEPLIEESLLKMTNPEKPTSSKQKYKTTSRGRELTRSNNQ